MFGIKTVTNLAQKTLAFTGGNLRTFHVTLEGGRLIKTTSLQGDMYASLKGWAYRALDLRANAFSNINHRVYRYKGGDVEEVFDHPVIDLLEHPSSILDSFTFHYLLGMYLAIWGEAPIYLMGGDKIEEMFPLRPDLLINKTDDNGVTYYEYFAGEKLRIEASEILLVRKPNPRDPRHGLSPVAGAAMEIETDQVAAQWNRGLLERDARPDGILSTESGLDPDKVQLLQERWQSKYGGIGSNRSSIAILEGGLKYQQIAFNPKDMDMLEGRRFNRDAILALLGVPKALIIPDQSNRANSEDAQKVFARYTVEPDMTAFTSAINHYLIPLLDKNIWIKHDTPVTEDRELRLNEVKALTSTVYTQNEARAIYDLPPVTGGDKLYVASNLFEVGTVEAVKHVPAWQAKMIKSHHQRNRVWNKHIGNLKPKTGGAKIKVKSP